MAYLFNGTTQYLNISDSILFNSIPLTMACWFKTSSNTVNQGILNITDATTGGEGYRLNAQGAVAGDPIRFLSVGSATNAVDTTTGFVANTWTHACGVVSSATSRTVYINGGSSATTTVDSTSTGRNILYAGVIRASSAFSNYLSGDLAEIGVWNIDLSIADIASLAKGMSPSLIRPEYLILYAPLVRDLIEINSALTITNNNTATVSNHTRIYS